MLLTLHVIDSTLSQFKIRLALDFLIISQTITYQAWESSQTTSPKAFRNTPARFLSAQYAHLLGKKAPCYPS